jgi:CRISPR-associated endonuclease/helicase Cas3
LLELFDTAPDLSGSDVDIQRFVRGEDPETDVHVFWRDFDSAGPPDDLPSPRPDELCNVPIGQFREFLKSVGKQDRQAAYAWDHLDGTWNKADPGQLRPGLVVLLPASLGRYNWDNETLSGTGWDPESRAPVPVVPGESGPEEGSSSDPHSASSGIPLTIAAHTANVERELRALLATIELPQRWKEHLVQAARWHDVGKGHDAFQHGVRSVNPSLSADRLWAKSGVKARLRHGRTHFRHELASALAVLQQGLPFPVAYFVGAHHGRVRLSIRALPGEDEPRQPGTPFALGIHDGDPLPAVDMGDEICPPLTLDLSPMRLGADPSWTGSALALLAEFGPFRLAYLEALLRIADARASRQEAQLG